MTKAGGTLIELSFALLLLAVVTAGLLPAARRQRDRAGLIGAREELAALVERTRSEALVHGGASLESGPGGRLEVRAADSLIASVDLATAYGVALHSGTQEGWVGLRFDALGIGRAASRSVRLTRGQDEVGLVVAAYGRVVRRRRARARRSGFTLVEVTVALVVLQVALLAAAGSLVLSHRLMSEAELRHRATQAAAALADSLATATAVGGGRCSTEWGALGWSGSPGSLSIWAEDSAGRPLVRWQLGAQASP